MKPCLARAVVAVVLCVSCNSEKRESDACLDARRRAHDAIAARDVGAASTALETARSECSQASEYDIDRLQRSIEREQLHQSQVTELAQQASSRATPLTPFVNWVRSNRESGARVPGKTECEARQSPRFGICVTQVVQDHGHPFELHYWQSSPNDTYRFGWELDAAVSCDDAGPHRLLRSWSSAGVDYQLCELTQHGLIGLRALVVRQPGNTRIDIYSPTYPPKDPQFAQRL